MLNLSKELLIYVKLGNRNAVSVLQGDLLEFVEKGTGFIIRNIKNFLDGDVQPATHGSVDVLSEYASIQSGHSTIDQGRQLTIEQSG